MHGIKIRKVKLGLGFSGSPVLMVHGLDEDNLPVSFPVLRHMSLVCGADPITKSTVFGKDNLFDRVAQYLLNM
ncbi:hypothetical protein OsccyDRAFT_0595 [Leptolyngbyaceae cyanobacterium JSC-12]|nr:hypothetical protein OsccyDRAFT_0595 [Leptolyngbyaceae cyanobacterium JSC-12]